MKMKMKMKMKMMMMMNKLALHFLEKIWMVFVKKKNCGTFYKPTLDVVN